MSINFYEILIYVTIKTYNMRQTKKMTNDFFVNFNLDQYKLIESTCEERNRSITRLASGIGFNRNYFYDSAMSGKIRKDVFDYINKWLDNENFILEVDKFYSKLIENTIDADKLRNRIKSNGYTQSQFCRDWLGKDHTGYLAHLKDTKRVPEWIDQQIEKFYKETKYRKV